MNQLFPAHVCRVSAALVFVGAALSVAQPSQAASAVQATMEQAGQGDALALTEGKGTLIRLTEDAGSIFVVDPTIADVHAPSPREVFVLGKKPGSTTLFVLGENNRTLVKRTVVVSRNMDTLLSMVHTRFPTMNIQLSANEGSLIVSGQATNAADADAVVQSLTPYLAAKETLVNRMTVSDAQQVQLQVKITEVDRNVTQELGINWQALGNVAGNFIGGIASGRQTVNYTSPYTASNGATVYPTILPTNNAYAITAGFQAGSTNISAVVDALNQEGLLTVLAEPNLVAMSGQTASFLAGGEFPIPVSQTNGAVSVEFKQFGVKLDFTPTVLNDGRISLKVRPEVSQIDSSVSVTTGGITVPGLSTRRADTTVELTSGQSFAIAGLLQNTTSDTVSQVPGLGALPILGKLFTSKNYTNNKTELVIMVTPYLVKPVNPGKLRGAIASLSGQGNDIEYTLRHLDDAGSGSIGLTPESQTAPKLRGAAGYVY